MPRELRKFVAPEFVFGSGALDRVGRYAAQLGCRNVMVVTDAMVAAAGWTSQTVASLDAAGVRCTVFADVTPNPRAEEVMAGADCFRASACDGLVAVGGGSAIDCAKGVGIVVPGNRHITHFEGVDRVEVPMPPLLCVPTSAGPAADVSQFAVITDPVRALKFSVISKALVPDLSLMDPRCATSLSPEQTAAMGMDALCHAIEAFVSTGNSPFTDAYAIEAIRRVISHLPSSVAAPGDLEERSGMMLAGAQAGLAFSNASLGLVHAMAHAIGGRIDATHGDCNALLLAHVIDFNFAAAPERYRFIAEVLGLPTAGLSAPAVCNALQVWIRAFCDTLGVAGTLTEIGVRRDDIPGLVQAALHDPCIVTNPRRPSPGDVEAIYEHAL